MLVVRLGETWINRQEIALSDWDPRQWVPGKGLPKNFTLKLCLQ